MLNDEFLKELTLLNGAPGFEQQISRTVKNYLIGSVDDFIYDNLGSIAAVHEGTDGPKVLIAGHMDELAFLVRGIDEDGFIHIRQMGGWKSQNMYAQRMVILTRDGKEIIGVFGAFKSSKNKDSDGKEPSDFVLDIGVDSKEEAIKANINIGDPIVPFSIFTRLTNPKYIMSKAMDDRIGILISAEVMKALKGEKTSATVYGGGTVQEELGARGARTLCHLVKPDIAFAVDVCYETDTDDSGKNDIKLGCGVVLTMIDSSFMANIPLCHMMENLCAELKLPFKILISETGGTDSYEFQKAFDGTINMTLSIPSRYMHSSNTVIHEDDVNNTITLLTEFCKRITMEDLEKIKQQKR